MTSAKPTERSKLVARHLAVVFGGQKGVRQFWDEARKSSVFVLTCKDTPQRGVHTYATVSLSEEAMTVDGKNLEIRSELIAAADSRVKHIDNAIATAAFYIVNSGYELFPGAVFPEVLKVVGASVHLKHYLFTAPFLWNNLESLAIGESIIAPLLAIPISDQEMAHAVMAGPASLERIFEEVPIDIFDLNRPSVL